MNIKQNIIECMMRKNGWDVAISVLIDEILCKYYKERSNDEWKYIRQTILNMVEDGKLVMEDFMISLPKT